MSLSKQIFIGLILLSIGGIIGFFLGSLSQSNKIGQEAFMNAKESRRQTYLAEMSKEEADSQYYHQQLSKMIEKAKEEAEKLEKLSAAKSPILGLRTTIYKVGDIVKAKKWYAEVFKKTPYFDEPYYVGFNIGGFELGLQPEESTAKKVETVVSYWGVNEIEKEYKRFLKLGAIENEKPQNVGGNIVTATVKDPWGNVIGLIYNPEFSME